MLAESRNGPLEVRAEASGFGAEIGGIDLGAEVSAAAFAAIRAALLRHKVLTFRDQHLDDDRHLAFAARFGPLEGHINRSSRHDRLPSIQIFGNVDAAGRPTGVHPERGTLVWHTDKSYVARPSLLTIIRSPTVARQGGDTLFADMERAYAGLEPARKDRLDGLRVVHDWKRSREKSGERPATAEEIEAAPPVDHPLVRTHPETGAKSLYIGNHTSHVLGMARAEGETLLADLERHATQERFVYRHRWRDNDVLMWDNRCTMHCVTPYDAAAERRVVHRAVVQGDVPV
jgi:taurine dioxygenase